MVHCFLRFFHFEKHFLQATPIASDVGVLQLGALCFERPLGLSDALLDGLIFARVEV
jgi:hypothetical protein